MPRRPSRAWRVWPSASSASASSTRATCPMTTPYGARCASSSRCCSPRPERRRARRSCSSPRASRHARRRPRLAACSSSSGGLLDAIGKYDPRKEASFSTYAQFRIRGAILDHLRSLDWVPRSVRQKASLIEKTAHTLEGALGRPPREEEIARELGLSLETYQELLARIGEMSLFSLEDLGFGRGEERLNLERRFEE